MIGSLVPAKLIMQREQGFTVDLDMSDEELVEYIDRRKRENFIEQAVPSIG
jgi:hypothetical protein